MASIAATSRPHHRRAGTGSSGGSRRPWLWPTLAFFAAPLLLLLAISFYDDTDLTRIGGSQWVKFFTDPFYLSRDRSHAASSAR